MPNLADDPEYRLALRQADQAREDFAILFDELDCVKLQFSRLPPRAWLSRMWSIGFASVWTLLAVIVLLLARVIWALLTRGDVYRAPQPQAV